MYLQVTLQLQPSKPAHTPVFCFEQRRCLRSDAALLRTTTQSAATYVVCRCASTRSTATRGLTPAERRGRQTTRSPQRRARSQSSLGIFSLRFLVKLQTQLFERLKLLALILFRFQRCFCLFFQEICLLTRWPCR